MTTAWLIEKGQPEGYSSVLWWQGAVDTWSGRSEDAVRFARKEDAERVIAQQNLHARAIEHAWLMVDEGHE